MSFELHALARSGKASEIDAKLNVGDRTKSKEMVGEKDKLSRTPLHMAAFFGHADAVKVLLDYGADVHAGATDGFTPLHFAAQNGHVDVCKLLIAAKSNVDRAVQNSARTPLHLAANKGHEAVIQLLLNKGANIEKVNRDGKKFIDCILDSEMKVRIQKYIDSSGNKRRSDQIENNSAEVQIIDESPKKAKLKL